MSESVELLLLRLGLFAVVFGTAAAIAWSLRSGFAAPAPERRAEVQPWRLVVEAPGESGIPRGTAFRLGGVMDLGRDGAAAIVLADPSVSARHARMERTARGWRLVDLGSTNGTRVNGRSVTGSGCILRGGERIQLGAVVLRLVPPSRS